jgi:hypothetical protein
MTSIRSAPSPTRGALGGGIVPLLLFLAGALCAGGCQSQQQKEPQSAVPATPDKVAAVRASIEQAQPGSLVGRVIAVHPDPNMPYVAVGDLPAQAVPVGDTITFVDADANPITSGTVSDKSAEALFVRYQSGKRRVEQGDLAVWFKSSAGGPTTAPNTQTARP